MSIQFILALIALVFAVLSLPWPNYRLTEIAVILLAVALLVAAH